MSESESDKPFILRRQIGHWGACKWTPDFLRSVLTNTEGYAVRFGSRTHERGKVLFETESKRRTLTYEQFLNWATIVDDSVVEGIEEKADDHWGTSGAYTPCHYDTYGFNLHAQIHGSKRWVLFPPNDDLRATRIPYEDSSVFSDLDILSCPDELRSCDAHVVVLEPGDVLYVPPKWWHFVQCLDLCVSINTWVPLSASDRLSRRREACTRTLVGLLESAAFLNRTEHFCPSEGGDSISAQQGLTVLTELYDDDDDDGELGAERFSSGTTTATTSAAATTTSATTTTTTATTTTAAAADDDRLPSKRMKWEDANDPAEVDSIHKKFLLEFSEKGVPVKRASFEELKALLTNGPLEIIDSKGKYIPSNSNNKPALSNGEGSAENKVISPVDFAKCLLHPEVISSLEKVIRKKIYSHT